MSVSAAQVKELREISGVGMMECKKALDETNGDIQKALDLLRSNSSLKAEKKSKRVAADGLILMSNGKNYTAIIEVNSETDFAAKDQKFLEFCDLVTKYVSKSIVNTAAELNDALKDEREALVQSIGENIQIRRLNILQSEGTIGSYLHSDSKLGALVSINSDNSELAKDLAMHVAASNPMCIKKEDIDQTTLNREKEIYKKQALESGKDDQIQNKMVEGKINRFLSEVSLLSQSFVKDPDKSIQELLHKHDTEVLEMVRFMVGEGIEVKEKDFAQEVADQLK